MNTGYEKMKSKVVWGVFGVLIVAVALVIIFAGKEQRLADRSEPVVDQGEVSSIAMQPVEVDDYTYQFEGVEWQFPVEEAGTRVNFMLQNFSRTEGAYVTFGNPYKLGFYEGECREIDSISYDKEKNPGIPVSYAECVAPGMTQQFVLFQQGEEVVAKLRRMYEEIEGDTESQFVTLYTVNLTEIVQ